jgi:DNA-binding MarR family transcriptional regulator
VEEKDMKARNVAHMPASEAPVESFEIHEFLPFRLAVAASAVNRLLARRFGDAYGLGISEWRVLAVIGPEGVVSPSAVGSMASMDKVKVSRASASLVARGLVKQSPDPRDGRGRLLRLTRKGASTYRGLLELAHESEDTLSGALNKSEWQALKQMLTRLETHAQSLSEDEFEREAAD